LIAATANHSGARGYCSCIWPGADYGFEAPPLMPEGLAKSVRQLTRDAAAIELFKRLAGPDALPSR